MAIAKLSRNVTPDGGDADIAANLCAEAIARYGARILDNIDLSRLDTMRQRARVIGKALMDRGDARAFALGRKLIAAVED